MPSIRDDVVLLTSPESLSDGLSMLAKHLPLLRNRLNDVRRADYNYDNVYTVFEDDSSLNVQGAVEDGRANLITCYGCRNGCERRAIISYTFLNSNTSHSASYCPDCVDSIINEIDEYLAGREDELLGDVL